MDIFVSCSDDFLLALILDGAADVDEERANRLSHEITITFYCELVAA